MQQRVLNKQMNDVNIHKTSEIILYEFPFTYSHGVESWQSANFDFISLRRIRLLHNVRIRKHTQFWWKTGSKSIEANESTISVHIRYKHLLPEAINTRITQKKIREFISYIEVVEWKQTETTLRQIVKKNVNNLMSWLLEN